MAPEEVVVLVGVMGLILGYVVGAAKTAPMPSEEAMIRRLVMIEAARKIKTRSREHLERQIAIASDAVASAKMDSATAEVCDDCDFSTGHVCEKHR